MFHVEHYSKISKFYNKVGSSIIENFSFDSLIDLINSNNHQKIFFYKDSIYNKIIDGVGNNWEDGQVLILAPFDHTSFSAPPGFNKYNMHSINCSSYIIQSHFLNAEIFVISILLNEELFRTPTVWAQSAIF